ncbi:MAG: N-acetylmuramoyl-L-alanine amidase [Acutalibacteraceae bacterium]|nr:N-acetylmuramoyl-L-alanine amidase [Acutalibacteraceae bacterium]
MVFKRKIAIILSVVLCLAILSTAVATGYEYITTSSAVKERQAVIIDAGHGGFDGGAVAPDGTVEKDINLKIALTLKDFLKQSGFRVIMTRESDVSTDDVETDKIATRKKSDLKNRLGLMQDNPNAIFVSIHLNKFTTSAANGSQVFYSAKSEESNTLGDCIQKSIVKLLQPENTRVNKQATSSTYLLYNATVPAVLVECGFLSNTAELKRLKDEEYQKKMAFSIFCGIMSFYSEQNF